MDQFHTVPFPDIQRIKGVPFPASLKFRQLIVTGPPGVGKSTLLKKIGGWSEEGYLDLTFPNWWRLPMLNIRPRELHLGLPFKGVKKALAVYDDTWLDATNPLELDLDRIQVPPIKQFFLSVDWRRRFAFEFMLLHPNRIFEKRRVRAQLGTHHVDRHLTLEQIVNQVAVYQQVAVYLQRCGFLTFIRDDFEGPPKKIIDPVE